MEIRSADRILLLELPPVADVQSMAAAATNGIVVGVLDRDAVYEARAALREFDNVMITPADDDGTLPWRDEFFSLVYAPSVSAPSAEMLRVLASGGTAWLAGGPVTKP